MMTLVLPIASDCSNQDMISGPWHSAAIASHAIRYRGSIVSRSKYDGYNSVTEKDERYRKAYAHQHAQASG